MTNLLSTTISADLDYEYILLTPSETTGAKVPLIVSPHGMYEILYYFYANNTPKTQGFFRMSNLLHFVNLRVNRSEQFYIKKGE